MSSMQKRLYMHTIGCQMNVYDSQQIARLLKPLGYELVPAEYDADLIIVNTCSVREKAEQKAFSLLGRLAALKQKKPGMIIAVGGCVAQQAGRSIFSRAPHVDLVFGTQAVDRIAGLIKAVQDDRRARVDIAFQDDFRGGALTAGIPEAPAGPCRFVTIMRGCNNFCTYCVVPYVRGREKSREPNEIIQEIKALAEDGCKEVTLLGQNVNSYGSNLEKKVTFAELLYEINKIDGIERIRFMTSHPKDLTDDLIKAIKECDKVCKHVHLPVQAGSNNILSRMNRKYTKEHYLNLVEKLKKAVPDIAITTDIIVGFPGETEEDFLETIDIVKKVQYDSAFTFLYSVREGTEAAKMENQVPDEVKHERFDKLLDVLYPIVLERNQQCIGKVFPVLVESAENDKLTGRTEHFRLVHFKGSNALIGEIVNVRITNVKTFHMEGEFVSLL